MLKEVGASGQISLGKKYAGQLFEVTVQPDGNIVMKPVKVVPVSATARETQAPYGPPAQTAAAAAPATREWAEASAGRIEQYNAWAAQREPYSQRVRRWRDGGQGL